MPTKIDVHVLDINPYQWCGQLLALCNNYITITFKIVQLYFHYHYSNNFLYQLPLPLLHILQTALPLPLPLPRKSNHLVINYNYNYNYHIPALESHESEAAAILSGLWWSRLQHMVYFMLRLTQVHDYMSLTCHM